MKILIADRLDEQATSALKPFSSQLTVRPDLTADSLPSAIADHEVLIVRSTKVTKATIESGRSLSLIIRAGAGVNNIDLNTANEYGIHVTNCPGRNNDAVAELAIGLMIAADRRIVDATSALRAGNWQKKEFGNARGLKGRTLGVIGFGAIGKGVAARAQGMEMAVIAYSIDLTPEAAEQYGVGYCKSLAELARAADLITIHVPALAETKGMIGGDFLCQVKPGAILINTSRGDVIDPEALKQAIEQRGLRVGLDVFVDEPGGDSGKFTDTELAKLITCTPHIGASTDQATEAIAQEVVRIVKTYKESGKPLNCVNRRERSIAHFNLVIRHYNRVGVLANILDELKAAEINVEEMENSIFQGGKTAACIIKIDVEPAQELMARLVDKPNIIECALKQ